MTTPNRPSSGAKASRLSQSNINDYDWFDASSINYTSYISFLKSRNLKISQRNLPHWELAGAIYFVTFSTWEKLELTPEARQVVLDSCLFFNNQRYKTYAVVIMPDHVHWLMQPLPKSAQKYWTLASIIHSIKSYSSKQVTKVMNHIGIVWQDERYDRIMRDEREFLETWNYIRENPIKANLSEIAERYPFFWQMDSVEKYSVK
ncbi:MULTISPECIES: transposase [unclassified Moorena]|uniref:REP-associated tyrosine transposase n=1 Tax=unclassified Moorena TaxID=2683338 RepID=UPI00257D3114|nr:MULTISPECIES: transposase [unclassified Moorena]